jgi:hypothetical protein
VDAHLAVEAGEIGRVVVEVGGEFQACAVA